MTKRNLVSKIFGIALVFVMVGSMFGGFVGSASTASAQAPTYEFLTYANFGSDSSCYTPGQGVGGYENKLYVATNGQYCYVYEVSIPEGADPNMHPDNPEATGPMAPRTLTFVERHDIRADIYGETGINSIYQSVSEFYVDDSGIYYGPGPGGIHKWDHDWNYQGRVVDVSLIAQTLAYDADNDIWYGGLAGRQIYSFKPGINTSWQYEFTYPTYEGWHHDGLEFVNGYLWISDMTSNWIGQWKKNPDGTWEELARFYYDNPVEDDVEGMGFGPLGHLWVTGWNRLYEIGGKELGVVLKGIKLSAALDKDEYNPSEIMRMSVRVIDADGNDIRLTRDNFEVKIDGADVSIEIIEDITTPTSPFVYPGWWYEFIIYLVKIKAPSEGGNHNIWVQVETKLGCDSAEETFTVGRIPVVLVHDYSGDPSHLSSLKQRLENDGFDVYVIDYSPEEPNCDAMGDPELDQGIEWYAKVLKAEIQDIKKNTGADKVDIVGYGMGGLIARYYVEKDNGNTNVRKLILLGTPNHGSGLFGFGFPEISFSPEGSGWGNVISLYQVLAKCIVGVIKDCSESSLIPGVCVPSLGKAAEQMALHSKFLNKLNYGDPRKWSGTDKLASGVQYVTIAGKKWFYFVSPYHGLKSNDGFVTVESVKLDGVSGANHAEFSVTHQQLIKDENVYAKIRERLQDDPVPENDAYEENLVQPQRLPTVYGTIPNASKLHDLTLSLANSSVILLRWDKGDLDLVLTTPDGIEVNSSTVLNGMNITYHPSNGSGFEGYEIEDPVSGNWQAEVVRLNGSETVTYTLITSLETELILSVPLEKYQYEPNEPINVTANLAYGDTSLTDAIVIARVKRPDASIENITLYDDGSHNDEAASDGIYANTYANTNLWGTYDIAITASGTVDDERFAREAFATVWVEQYPDLTLSDSDIYLSNNNPDPGEEITINATIHNVGEADARNASILFYAGDPVGGTLIGEDIIDVEAGKTAQASTQWTAAEEVKQICVLVSSYNEFLEEDYTNNRACARLIYPDMWMDILTAEETPGIEQHRGVIETLADEPCNLTVYVRNTGTEVLHNLQVVTNVNFTQDIGNVTEGQVREVPIQFTPTTPGLSGLNVTVESDEIESSLTRTLLVEKFDLTVSIPKTEYGLNEPVPINISVTNEVPGMRFIDLKIEVNISGSYNQTFEIPLLSLAPLATKDTTFTWNTTGVSSGAYTIVTSFIMADREVAGDEKCVTINPTNLPPIADAGPDQTVERTKADGANITLDGSGSFDPDGDPITYNWTWIGGSASGVSPTVVLPMGTTTLTLTVSDAELWDADTVNINVVDTTPPEVVIGIPGPSQALQDGVTLTAEASDLSGVSEVYFYVREPNGTGIPIGYEDLMATLNSSTGKWECLFDTTLLPDGYYVVLAKAVDNYSNEGWSEVVPFSIRNWAVLELLPASQSNKGGRTMPVKFSLRIAESVDPAQPFVYNEELEIRIYDASDNTTILQTSLYGDTSRDYRIDSVGEKYITNFKTKKQPATYTVEIWRTSKNFLIGSFTFETVK